MPKETIGKTFLVALLLCVVCSVLVSAAAVYLRPTQAANKNLDRKKNILMAADLLKEGLSVEEAFKSIEPKVVNLATGEYVEDIDAESYDQRRAAREPAESEVIPPSEDIASVRRKAKRASVYLIYRGDEVRKIILPLHGLGLWSTLYGFVALDARDLNTIRGLVYYEHGETPGLGGEVDNPAWKALWNGKQVFDQDGKVRIEVVKGKVVPNRPETRYQVDGLSGATITARGVSNMLRYWLGKDGFGPYLDRLKARGARHG